MSFNSNSYSTTTAFKRLYLTTRLQKKYEREHNRQMMMLKKQNPRVILCGDSIMKNFELYPEVWKDYFDPINAINCGIGGDRTQHLLWRIQQMDVPSNATFAVIHCGTNNIDHDPEQQIANGVMLCGATLLEKQPRLKIIVTALLPRDFNPKSKRRKKIDNVNTFLKEYCRLPGFVYMDQGKDFTLLNGELDKSLYYTDDLHLVSDGYVKFAKSITNVIMQQY